MASLSIILRVSLSIFLAIFMLVSGLAESANRNRQYASAVQLFGDSGAAWSRLAAAYSANGEDEKAADSANRALDYSLGHVRALRSLGLAAVNSGQTERGSNLIGLAGTLSWRDGLAHSWLFEQALRQGKYANAMQHADALLRRGKAQEEIFSIFNLAALDDNLLTPLVWQFENRPNWRGGYFSFAKRMPVNQYSGFERLVAALDGGKAPVTRSELLPYASLLLSRQQNQKALQIWEKYFADETTKSGSILSWPADDNDGQLFPSDWRLTSNREIGSRVLRAEGGDDILAVELTDGARGEIAWRFMLVKPGVNRIQLQDSYGNGVDDSSFRWSARCLPEGAKRYFEKSAVEAFVRQIEFGEGCKVYRLALELKLGGLSGAKNLRLPPPGLLNQ